MKQKILSTATSLLVYLASFLFPFSLIFWTSQSLLPSVAQTPEDLRKKASQLEKEAIHYLRANQRIKAIQSWQKVLQIWRQLEDIPQQVRVLENLGKLARLIKQNEQARQFLQEGLTLAQKINNSQAEASILSEIGYIYYLTKDYQQAEKFYKNALLIAQKIKDFKQIAVSAGSLGLISYARENYPQAVQFHQQSLEASKKINSLKDIFTGYFKLGDAYKAQNLYAQAIEAYQQALEYAINLNRHDKIIFSLDNLGKIYRVNKKYELAIQHYQKMLEVAQKINNSEFQREALLGLGSVYWEQEEKEKALQYHQQALDILIQDKKDIPQIVEALKSIGNLYRSLKKYEQAIEQYQKLLEIAREKNDVDNILYALSVIGWTYYQQDNNNNRAQQYYQKIVEIAQDPKTINDGLVILTVLAKRYQEQGNNNQANQFRAQAGNIAEDSYQKNKLKDPLIFLGEIYEDDKNYSDAIEAYTSLFFQASKVNDYPALVIATNKLNNIYYEIGDCETAGVFASFHINFAKEIKDRREEATGLLRKGNINYCQGKSEEALSSYQGALEIARELEDIELEGFLLGNIGLVYIHLGEYQEAIVNLEQDLAIIRQLKDKNNRQDEGQALGMLGDAYYAQGNYTQAIDFYQQSLAIAKEVSYDRGTGLMLTNIGESLVQLKKYSEAETTLKEALAVLTSLRSKVGDSTFGGDPGENKIAIFQRETRTYRLLQRVLVEQNKFSEALEIAEASRARILAEILVTKSSSSNSIINVASPKLAELKEIAKEKNATLIEYSLIANREDLSSKIERELYIWVISPNGNIAFQKSNLTAQKVDLKTLIQQSRESMGLGGRGSIFEVTVNQVSADLPLKELYQVLIEPIKAFLPKDANARIIFIPQEELFMVPFVALKDAQDTYLINNYTISIAPSIQTLKLTQNRETKSALVVGNPIMPKIKSNTNAAPEPLPQLPGAEKEAKAIAQILNTQPLIGAAATKKAVLEKISSVGIIHLATHGLLDIGGIRTLGYGGNGMIALTPAEGDKSWASSTNLADGGLLDVEEIARLNLKADLVVLSACDTGRGKIAGEGVLGLSRAFLVAGVPSTIVSLWSVPDAPTAELMSEFYRNWQQRKLDKAQALRQAMLTLMKQHPSPRDWAAFSLIGQPE